MGQKEREEGRVVGYRADGADGAGRARFEALPAAAAPGSEAGGGKGGELYQRAEASAEATDENKSYRMT